MAAQSTKPPRRDVHRHDQAGRSPRPRLPVRWRPRSQRMDSRGVPARAANLGLSRAGIGTFASAHAALAEFGLPAASGASTVRSAPCSEVLAGSVEPESSLINVNYFCRPTTTILAGSSPGSWVVGRMHLRGAWIFAMGLVQRRHAGSHAGNFLVGRDGAALSDGVMGLVDPRSVFAA